MNWSGVLFAVALGLLAHSLLGYTAFPFGDDFAYAPLADYHANPDLFPRDDQLRLFQNHAQVYEWLYRLGVSGPGVEPVFRVAIWVLSAATAVALLIFLNALGAPAAALPVVLGLGVLVRLGGIGRGDYGDLVSPFFHHHNVALALVLGAVAAAILRKSWVAGLLLGMAVFAQPMTAFHGALVAGLGSLTRNPFDAVKMAIAAIVVAIPAAIPILGSILGASDPSASIDLVQEAYRFRAPVHYDPPGSAIGLATLYLLAGWAGVVLLARTDQSAARFAAGLMIGFTLLHVVTLTVYKGQIAEWVGFFILDANRSTPALFVLGPALALAGIYRSPQGPAIWATGLLLLIILALNYTASGLAFVALGAVLFTLREARFLQPVLFTGLGAALLLLFPPSSGPPTLPASTLAALERIRTQTPQDALFVIPVGFSAFRHYSQRSAYVDFKLFSVAQPDQAALTRSRMEEVADPAPAHLSERGWRAAQLWEEDQHRAATCDRMEEILAETGAEYFVRRVATGEKAPDCAALPSPIHSETLAVYGPSG